MNYYMGIDIGSVTSKGVIVSKSEIITHFILPSGTNYSLAAEKLTSGLLNQSGLNRKEIKFIIATGQGSSSVNFRNQSTADMRCCTRGIYSLFPSTRTVIDIEGQST